MIMKILNLAMIIGGILLCLFGITMNFVVVSRMLCFSIVVFGIFAIVCGALPFGASIFNFKHVSLINNIMRVILLIVLVISLVISMIMAFGINRYDGDNKGQTLIVLGCSIDGENPSYMMACRLDKAAEFMQKNKNNICVVSGGKGQDEALSESEVMKRYLMDKGISADKIVQEDKSSNTEQNIKNSASVIKEKKLCSDVIIVTDLFHQYRSEKVASKYDLNPQSMPCYTRPDLSLLYWIREIPAVIKNMIINGI